MMRTTFNDNVKRWQYKRFKETFGSNKAVLAECGRYGLTLEELYTKVTGRKPEKNVRKAEKKDSEAKD